MPERVRREVFEGCEVATAGSSGPEIVRWLKYYSFLYRPVGYRECASDEMSELKPALWSGQAQSRVCKVYYYLGTLWSGKGFRDCVIAISKIRGICVQSYSNWW